MTPKPPIDRHTALRHAQKSQRWGLFGIAIIGVVLAQCGQLALAKGLTFGALVAFLMQFIFAFFSFRRVRPHPKQMINDMYVAMLTRFGVGVLGFLVAFAVLKLNGLGVVAGFLAMWGWIVLSLAKIR